MANPAHFAKLSEGVKEWNRWRTDNTDIVPDLNKAQLRDVTLRWLSKKGRGQHIYANLSGADLAEADLNSAKLIGVKLSSSNLSDATLVGADLYAVDLRGANLTNVNFNGASLKHVILGQADLTRSIFASTVADCDLSRARGLNSVYHIGPSSIGIDTLFRSKGDIPDSFLRGCGVPDQLITYARSLIGQAPGSIPASSATLARTKPSPSACTQTCAA